jgi:hypothetical protein
MATPHCIMSPIRAQRAMMEERPRFLKWRGPILVIIDRHKFPVIKLVFNSFYKTAMCFLTCKK